MGPGHGRRQAARTVERNFCTSAFSRLLSPESDWAEESTCDEAEPVSLDPRCTSVIFDATKVVPCEACCTLREISWVAAPCSSTADAIVDEISEIRRMVLVISRIARTELWVAVCIAEICCPISPVALA